METLVCYYSADCPFLSHLKNILFALPQASLPSLDSQEKMRFGSCALEYYGYWPLRKTFKKKYNDINCVF